MADFKNRAGRSLKAGKWHTAIKLLLVSIFLMVHPFLAEAEMSLLSDEKMSGVTAGTGLTVFVDTRFKVSIDTIDISDTDSDPVNWFRFKGFTMDDGNDQGFKISTIDMDEYIAFGTLKDPLIVDIGTTLDGRTSFQMNLTPFSNPIFIHADEVEFCNQPIGSMDLNGIEIGAYSLVRFSHHMDNSSGVELDADFSLDMGSFQYTYNDSGDSFSINGLHLAETYTGAAEDPSSWEISGNFKIGDLDTNPAQIDVADNGSGQSIILMSLPMSGSIMLEDISLNGQSFGPAVFESVQVHRLSVVFAP